MTDHFLGRNASWERLPQDSSLLRGANITSAGAHNRKIVLHAIRSSRGISRPDIAKSTGLTLPAIFNISKELLRDGLITVHPTSAKAMGRPIHTVRLNADAAFTLGLGIDRDMLTFVAMDFAGNVRYRHHLPMKFAMPADVRNFMTSCVARIERENLIPMPKVIGTGVAIPDDLGSVTLPGQPAAYSRWCDVDLCDLIGDVVSRPVIRENDAAAAAIGEMSFGHGLDLDSFFYVFIGAGLGGGLVINRRYVRGAHGRSGEIGFLPQVNPLRNSQTHLRKTLGDAVLVSDLLDEFVACGHKAPVLETLHQLPGADAILERWIGRVADYLYLPLLTVMAVLDPEAILVGGHLPPAINQALCEQISRRLSMHVGMAWPQMAVRAASVSQDAAAAGAAFIAFQGRWEGSGRV